MNEFNIAAPLAAALAAKGYASLTAVQQAAINPEIVDRDLLVSAQTGSGKTVAFGLAAAPQILGEDDVLAPAGQPIALAIAPTRELALQVAAELTWLYGEAGAKIATCVGGMDYRTEKRNLDRGAHIVVGTPGRLRDHIERGSLDMTALKVAVLDEADEMLDLGFREDLEFILESAPEDRRTLMFSATVPPAIEKLARDFQKDALRVAAMGEARQHGDITYRALSVTARDRENAIFNLLRFYEARTAIIFCKTRANVNHLLARMGNRGFRVVALSGELSQQERTHALQALRDGRASVCIATDVAARGIDLPGLELVIHADLPSNSETMLHRSGRTGRAGSKGVSALVVTPADYKKAQRLLQGARVQAEWGKAPSADDVLARDDERMFADNALNAELEDMAPVHALLEKFGAEKVAAAFVQLWRSARPVPEEITEVQAPSTAAPREARTFGDSVWFSLSVGHTGRAEARWLLPKLCDAGGITRDAIGAIRIREEETFVQIAVADAPRFGEVFEIEPELILSRLPGEPALERRGPPSGPRKFGNRDDRGPRKFGNDRGPRDGGFDRGPREDRGFRDDRGPREERAPRKDWEDRKPREDRGPRPSEVTPRDPSKKPRWSEGDKAAAKSAKSGEGKLSRYASTAPKGGKSWDRPSKAKGPKRD